MEYGYWFSIFFCHFHDSIVQEIAIHKNHWIFYADAHRFRITQQWRYLDSLMFLSLQSASINTLHLKWPIWTEKRVAHIYLIALATWKPFVLIKYLLINVLLFYMQQICFHSTFPNFRPFESDFQWNWLHTYNQIQIFVGF